MKRLPKLSHLQALVLAISSEGGEQWGKEFREKLAVRGCRMSGPAFYQLMARMEEAGLVRGSYETKIIKGQTLKQRRYRPTGEGQKALRNVLDFYAETARASNFSGPQLSFA
jgi:DNA-binding PadR family transcriptional regulator